MKAKFEYLIDKDKLSEIKQKVLYGVSSYSTFVYLDNNEYQHQPNRYELLAAVGCKEIVSVDQLDAYRGQWLFGHLRYDFKNTLFPKLSSSHQALDTFDEQHFFVPEIVLAVPFQGSTLQVYCDDSAKWKVEQLLATTITQEQQTLQFASSEWSPIFSEQAYKETVRKVKDHITAGNCYELNLCTAYVRAVSEISPVRVFDYLNTHNPAPFASFYRIDNQYLLSTSPERYLYKHKDELLSQPIKGTIKKANDDAENERLKSTLFYDIKERAENVMITDLVRNDLAQLSEPGSVHVKELFGVYTFESLHHLISTIQAKILPDTSMAHLLTKPFPMGSMTGAPKYIVMETIEALEQFKRGIYAGTIGYIQPNMDFDFNVVIRSVVYNTATQLLAFHAGGAITIDSDEEQEWQEIQLKAKRNMELLAQLS